jgi:DNA (cytosine-5)-methyltransferase 1
MRPTVKQTIEVLDLFSAAAGGWSLGMHRAGFKTMAACEFVDWRRALYQENNPDVRIYGDVRTLTADQLVRDFGRLPSVVVGSPPCQDISSANTKGKGVEGERSGLYFEAIRIIGECRPRWFALENSSNLRTRGADAVIAALEAIGYTVWSYVVGAGDVGANHERKRSWLVGCDLSQVTDAGSREQWQQPRRRDGSNWAGEAFNGDDDQAGLITDPDGIGRNDGRSRGRSGVDISNAHGFNGQRHDGDANREPGPSGFGASSDEGSHDEHGRRFRSFSEPRGDGAFLQSTSDSSGKGRWQGQGGDKCLEAPTREAVGGAYAPSDARIGDRDAGPKLRQVGGSESPSSYPPEPWADWNSGLAGHLRVDDGISSWLAGTRVALGTPKGTSAASLIVEAFGDAVVPQIPEAIGRAILRTEAALAAVYSRAAA